LNARGVFRNRKQHLVCLVLAVCLMVSAGFNVRQSLDVHEDGLNEEPVTSTSENTYATDWPFAVFPYLVEKINATLANITLPWTSTQIKNFTWLNFTFTWEPDSQRIVRGEFHLNIGICFQTVTVTVMNKNDSSIVGVYQYHYLEVVVEATDDDYSPDDFAGLVFDANQNGYIDDSDEFFGNYLALADDTTLKACVSSDGEWAFAEMPPVRGSHHAIFDSAKGYTFRIHFPTLGYGSLDPLGFLKKGDDNVLHVSFSDGSKQVFTRFLFHIPEGLEW